MFQRLPGFRDFYPAECAVRNWVFARWREAARRFGFQEVDGPLLEPLELFTAKSGEEIAGQLFHFEDRGGRAVSLRPELTPSLTRMVAARANALRRPIKWFNVGEHFRYEKQQKGRLRAFYQLNVDLLGEASPAADAEVIATLVGCLDALGLTPEDYRIRLSDRALWWAYLEGQGVPEEAIPAVLGVIDRREREPPDVQRTKLADALGGAAVTSDTLLAAIEHFVGIRDLAMLEAEATALPGLAERLGDWRLLWEHLGSLGVAERVQLDFSIVRGLAYYTGFVFEAFQTMGSGRALAGGGRYDHLVEKLGGPSLPAVGFGMGDVTVTDLLSDLGRLPGEEAAVEVYLVPVDGPAQAEVRVLAGELRAAGYRVDYPLKTAGVGKLLKAAIQSGARFAILLGPDERAEGVLKLRDLQRGEEQCLPRAVAIEVLGTTLAG